MRPRRAPLTARAAFVLTSAMVLAGVAGPRPSAADTVADTVTEIHYSYGDTSDRVVFDWVGTETQISYGLDATYGQSATASPSTVSPVDSAGPFQEAVLTGLQPATTYHYRVGATGADHTFRTVPTGDFSWVDVGDTGATTCKPWLAETHALVAAQNPDFVTHGGDISYANECGVPAVHQYYVDQQVWSTSAAFEPVWGNHEYGPPRPGAPARTPRDSMANYKGRSFVTHAQEVPNDTAARVKHPGCGRETGSTVNTCRGEDWGWFVAGHVLFVSYPEPWPGAITDWQRKAAALMASAQVDPSIDFIVTYGHRPARTSLSGSVSRAVRQAVDWLALTYAPTAAHPDGKYVLNVAHHVHGLEVFAPVNGLVNITDGGGGVGQVNYTSPPDPSSVWRTVHPGLLAATYSAVQHTLAVSMLCGPDIPTNVREHCTYGTQLYAVSFTHTVATPPPPVVRATVDDGANSVPQGKQTTYTLGVSNLATGGPAATGVTLAAQVPATATVVDADGGTVAAGTVTWAVGDLAPGQGVTHRLDVRPDSGSSLTVAATASTTDGSCSAPGSSCTASDTDTVVSTPTTREWVLNPGAETDLTGWTGRYGPSPSVAVSRTTTIAHSGVASILVAASTGATNLSSGFNAIPRWVASTTAGTTYTQSAWVYATFVGQKLRLRLREWHGATLVADQQLAVTAASVGWQLMSQTLTASASGDQLSFAVYAVLSAGSSFYADDLSLTSPG